MACSSVLCINRFWCDVRLTCLFWFTFQYSSALAFKILDLSFCIRSSDHHQWCRCHVWCATHCEHLFIFQLKISKVKKEWRKHWPFNEKLLGTPSRLIGIMNTCVQLTDAKIKSPWYAIPAHHYYFIVSFSTQKRKSFISSTFIYTNAQSVVRIKHC